MGDLTLSARADPRRWVRAVPLYGRKLAAFSWAESRVNRKLSAKYVGKGIERRTNCCYRRVAGFAAVIERDESSIAAA